MQQLAEMAKVGVQPDTLAGTALLDACARCGKLDMMQAVFDELFANGESLTGGLVVCLLCWGPAMGWLVQLQGCAT